MLTFTFSTYFITFAFLLVNITILLTKTIAARTEDALSYYRVRGLYSPTVVFVAITCLDGWNTERKESACFEFTI